MPRKEASQTAGPPVLGQVGTLKARFDELDSLRQAKMRRAWECAELTIPSLLPRQHHTPYKDFPQRYDSLGARLVNGLSSKVMMTLFPVGIPFFKMTADEKIVQQLAELEKQAGASSGVGIKAQVDAKLWVLDTMTQNQFERQGIRQRSFEVIKTLMVTGDIALSKLPGKKLKAYNLNNFVASRDGEGELIALILRETVGYAVLPAELQRLVNPATLSAGGTSKDPKSIQVELFTMVERIDAKRFRVYQELDGVRVPNSLGTYKVEELPYMALRWNEVLGESYGRGMVEDYVGDLRTLENDAHAVDALIRLARKIVPLLNPNGQTQLNKIKNAQEGEWVYGRKEDITFVTAEKTADFQVVHAHAQDLRNGLQAAFLSNTSIQRNGERVTAEEIKTMAADLEDSLGGVYSLLSQEFQLPLVKLLYGEVKKELKSLGAQGDLELDKDLKITITTGLDALGRGHDASRLRQFVGDIVSLQAPEVLAWLKIPHLMEMLATARGIDSKGLIKTIEERQQEIQQAQEAAAQQQIMQGAAGAIPGVAKQAVAQGGLIPQQQQ